MMLRQNTTLHASERERESNREINPNSLWEMWKRSLIRGTIDDLEVSFIGEIVRSLPADHRDRVCP